MVAISAGFSFQEKGIPDDVIQAEKSVHVSGGESDEWEVGFYLFSDFFTLGR